MACHGSANLELAIPNYVAPVEDRSVANAANDGTNRHEIFAKVMDQTAGDLMKMASAIQYVADLRSTRRFKVLIEHKITAWWLQDKPSTTVDLALYTSDELHVLDLKSGKIPVPVHGNAQLKYYGACLSPLAPKAKGITLHVLQPWANGNDSVWVDNAEIAQFIVDTQATEAAIKAGDLTLSPSDNCQFCPANPHGRGLKGRPLCPVMLDLLYPSTRVDEDEMLNL
jgi:hypothetical protein